MSAPTHHHGNAVRSFRSAQTTDAFGYPDRPLNIAVINNMSDGALRATETQYCNLFAKASAGLLVDIKFYTLPGVPRGEAATKHVARHYDQLAALKETVPDGMIVTGAEPQSRELTGEAFWPALSRLVDWADSNGVPTIWSCLAAHAAVLRLDGIERVRLPTKLSGIYSCRIRTPHQTLLAGMPLTWSVPHSRLHDLPERSLEQNGYTVVSRSNRVGADMFMRLDGSLHLFLQGHPEYGPETLMAEYRRDVQRATKSALQSMPPVPHGLTGRVGLLRRRNSPDQVFHAQGRVIQEKGLAPGNISDHGWARHTELLMRNWLFYVFDHAGLSSRRSATISGLTQPKVGAQPAPPAF